MQAQSPCREPKSYAIILTLAFLDIAINVMASPRTIVAVRVSFQYLRYERSANLYSI